MIPNKWHLLLGANKVHALYDKQFLLFYLVLDLSPWTVIQHHWLEPLVRDKALVKATFRFSYVKFGLNLAPCIASIPKDSDKNEF